MARLRFEMGETVTIFVDFTTVLGALFNPSTVSCTVRLPDKTTVVKNFPADITNPTVGHFQFPYLLATEGTYYWRFTGQSSGVGTVKTGSLDAIREPNF